jgi:hypothetical protein
MRGTRCRLAIGLCLSVAGCSNGGGQTAGTPTPTTTAQHLTTPGTGLVPATEMVPTTEASLTSPPATAAYDATSAPPTIATPTTGQPATTTDSRPRLFDHDGELAPGTYVVDTLGRPIHITVPAGWSTFGAFALVGPDGSYLAFWDVADVFLDACRANSGLAGIGPTVADLVAGLGAQGGSETTDPLPLAVDGFDGTELVLSAPPSVDFASCDGGEFRVWIDDEGGDRFYSAPGEVETLWILDLDGERGVINFGSVGPMSGEAQAQIEAMLASLDIE